MRRDAAGTTQHLQVVTASTRASRRRTPAALPTYRGRSSSVMCHAPRLRVSGGSGVEEAGGDGDVGEGAEGSSTEAVGGGPPT